MNYEEPPLHLFCNIEIAQIKRCYLVIIISYIQNYMIHNVDQKYLLILKCNTRINIYKKDYEKKWTFHYHSKTRI